MIVAGIDIGTNTFRLLIAEIDPATFREIHSDRKITRLGQQLDLTGKLSQEAQDRSLDALADFSRSIKLYNARAVSAVGTSALRNASNANQFLSEARKRSGIEIKIITGIEEAKLTLLGVTRALFGSSSDWEKRFNSALVIDVGGGSTEIITICSSRIRETSLPLGAVYLTERFIHQDPPNEKELERLRQWIRSELDESNIADISPEMPLIGTAGAITTLSAMAQELAIYDPEKINRSTLTRETIDHLIHKLSRKSLEERRAIPGLERGREDIILAGALIVQEIMRKFSFEKLHISDGGLREGIVLDLYRRLQAETHP